jgi:hypothetical protein
MQNTSLDSASQGRDKISIQDSVDLLVFPCQLEPLNLPNFIFSPYRPEGDMYNYLYPF